MRTILWFLYFWLVLPCYLPALRRLKKLDAAGKIEERDQLMEASVSRWARSLLKVAGVKVTITGKENIPDGPAVFVGNHQGNFDIPILLAYLDRPHGFVAKIETQKLPVIRTWMQYLHCAFVDRENPRQAMGAIGDAAKMVTQGYPIILFPEGTRSRGDRMNEFKSGGLRIALKSKAPIVPVVMNGSYKVMEAHGFWIHPATVQVTILPPVKVENLSREEQKNLHAMVQKMIGDQLNQQLK